MKNKKQHAFGNSNYRKMNVETKKEIWFHLEKDTEGNLLGFVANPDVIKSCFESKRLSEKSKVNIPTLCAIKSMGKCRPGINSVKDFFDQYNAESSTYVARNIDEFFKVKVLPDRKYMGFKVSGDDWLAFIGL